MDCGRKGLLVLYGINLQKRFIATGYDWMVLKEQYFIFKETLQFNLRYTGGLRKDVCVFGGGLFGELITHNLFSPLTLPFNCIRTSCSPPASLCYFSPSSSDASSPTCPNRPKDGSPLFHLFPSHSIQPVFPPEKIKPTFLSKTNLYLFWWEINRIK